MRRTAKPREAKPKGDITESLENALRWPQISMEELGQFLRAKTGNPYYTAQNCLRILRRYGAVREEKRAGAAKGRHYTTLDEIREAFVEQWDYIQKERATVEEDW
jgi:hypothetical protein